MTDFGLNKYSYGGSNKFDSTPKPDNVFIGEVVNTDDFYDGNRIRVRIKGLDDKTDSDLTLPQAFPLLPKLINVMPKVGESVFIFLLKLENKYQNRLWLGPIISQPQKLNFDPHNFSSRSLITAGIKDPERAPSTLEESKGVYPNNKGFFNKEDVAIQGRDNSDIVLRSNEVVLRAGKFEVDNNLKFNKKNMGYIQIKHDVNIDSNETKGTVTNIVSDKINLLSHNGIPRFTLNDQNDLITDEELTTILEKTQPLPYGNVLLAILNLFKTYMVTHVHDYPGKPPSKTARDVFTNDFGEIIKNLLSNNIRIN